MYTTYSSISYSSCQHCTDVCLVCFLHKLAHDEDEVDESHDKDQMLSDILRHILLQCIESTADARWELRRMGQQVSEDL